MSLIPGLSLRSNPGLRLANAFGVFIQFQTDALLPVSLFFWSCFRRRAVPVLDVGITDDCIAFVDRLDGLAFFLIKPFAVDNDQSLSRRMRVPIASSTRLERYAGD